MKKLSSFLLTVLIIASTVTAYGATYTLTSASYPINVNGQKLAVEPLNYNGTTYLPLRSISEAVGVPIEWDGGKKSVEINTVDVEKLKEACVMIEAYGDGMISQGSAVCWDYGEYLTAYHVIDEDRTMITDSVDAAYNIERFDSALDVAVLRARSEVKPVKIGDSDEVKVGDRVIVVGSPDGKENVTTYTTVKKLTSDIVIHTTLSGGGSGSALFDSGGNLIGIVVASSVQGNESYAVPINDIRKAL